MVFLAVISVPGFLISLLGAVTSFWHPSPFPVLRACYLLSHLSLSENFLPLHSEVCSHVGFSHF